MALLFAMRDSDASKVIAVTSAYPVITLLLAVSLFGESISWSKVGSRVAIAAGPYLLNL